MASFYCSLKQSSKHVPVCVFREEILSFDLYLCYGIRLDMVIRLEANFQRHLLPPSLNQCSSDNSLMCWMVLFAMIV